MKKRFLLTAMAVATLATSLQAQRHEGAPEPQSKLSYELGLAAGLGVQSNLSPSGLKYQTLFDGWRPVIHGQLLYNLGGREALGLEVSGTAIRSNVDDLSATGLARQSFIGVALAHSTTSARRLFLRHSFALGYVHTQHVLQNWSNGDKEKFNAPGVGASYRLTLGFRLSHHQSLGLQLGLQANSSFKWSGNADKIDANAYSGGLFGKHTNQNFYPTIGLVLTNPLGR